MENPKLEELAQKARDAPKQPGVYVMKNASGKIVYIGKAKNLKNRLSSYFPTPKDALPKTIELCNEAASIETTVTDNEAEALILEANLIRENRPKYNIDLKDSHKYAYVLLSKEEFPRLLTVRKNSADQFAFQKEGLEGRVFGPFTAGSSRLGVLNALRKAFGLRTCNKIPKKVCLKYHLKQCSGPCEQKISREAYLQNVKMAVSVLKGETGGLEKTLRDGMNRASDSREYELALALKNRLEAVHYLATRQKMEMHGEAGNEDYIALAQGAGKASVAVFKTMQGVVREREQYAFETIAEDALSEFLSQYYSTHTIPNKAWVSQIPQDAPAIEEFLDKTRGASPEFSIPKGEKMKLLELVQKNAVLNLGQGDDLGTVELKKALRLLVMPRTIECFDISTLFGTNSVGSMVRFENGKPDKSNYRRFKIKFVDGQDDFSMIREVVYRRYYRIKMEGGQMPDLVMVDGGKPQLSAAKQALDDLGYSLQPLIALAKQFEEIYSPERLVPLQLDRKNAGLQLLMRTRDEAHRFAISYHKKLRATGAKA